MRKAALAVLIVVAVAWGGWQLLPGPRFAPVALDAPQADDGVVDAEVERPAAADERAAEAAPEAPADTPQVPPFAGARRPGAGARVGRGPGDGAPQGIGPRAGADAMRRGPPGVGADVRRDLRADEARGGHTIARHVAKTDEQLRERLARESISAASTYPDLETAERVVGLTLARHAARLEQWLAREGARPNLVLPFVAPRQPPIGRVLRRGAEPVDAYGAVVVLRWQDDGYYVLTSYPEVRRRGR